MGISRGSFPVPLSTNKAKKLSRTLPVTNINIGNCNRYVLLDIKNQVTPRRALIHYTLNIMHKKYPCTCFYDPNKISIKILVRARITFRKN